MSVFRVEKTKGYTVMSNHHLRNHALSLKAKGLLSQMLSLPRLEVMELTAASILKSQRLGRMVHISDEEVAALKETYHLEG